MRQRRVWARLLGLGAAVVEDVRLGERGELVVAARPRWSERDRCGRCRRRCPGFDLGEGRRPGGHWISARPRPSLRPTRPGVRCPQHGVRQPGTTTNRIALREMLAQLPVLRPTFVIVYDLSRLARDDFDALYLLAEIEKAGSRLESTLERVDNTPPGRLLYTVMAGVNAFRSRGDAEKVRMGQIQKHAAGGTNGPAPLGYLNVRQLVEGREVRTVALDEDRYRLVQLAFDAFATGEHSITSLRDLLEEVGLHTRPTPKRPAKPLSRNGIYHILRDDYYIGIVTLNGVKRPGLHQPLVDRETFGKVQRTLDAHRPEPVKAGETLRGRF